ncbi:MAG TPA: DinB family protein [candidate division Zixibacteria bacterium]|nr:DinB family protein [candidate division Zixibacteria bacterium]
MTDMQTKSSFAPTANLFRLNAMLVHNALKDIDPEHLTVRPNDTVNSFAWLLGHITRARFGIARLCGLDVEVPFGELFARGQGAGDSDDYPSIDTLKAKYKEAAALLNKRFAEISDAELDAPVENEYPSQEKNLRGALTFLVFHESVHVGQMMSLRRYFGYSGLVG